MKLKDKVAIVTGGARGIGEAIVRAYAAEGAHVAIADVETAKAESLAAELGGKAFAVRLDVRDAASIDGDGRRRSSPGSAASTFWSTTPASSIWDRSRRSPRMISTASSASTSAGFCSSPRRSRAQMIAQGRGGKIINMSSQAGRRGEPRVTVYCASKAAVISITQSLGLELIKHRINVNGIAPGVVDTPMWDHVDSLFAKVRESADRREEAAGRRGRALRPHGPARRLSRAGGVSRLRRRRLRRRADAQCRRRKLDELIGGAKEQEACHVSPPLQPSWPGRRGHRRRAARSGSPASKR